MIPTYTIKGLTVDNGWDDYPALDSQNGHDGWGDYPVAPYADARPNPPKPRTIRTKLSTAAQVRREIAKIYRQMKAGSIAIAKGAELIRALKVLSSHIESENAAKAAEALERLENKAAR